MPALPCPAEMMPGQLGPMSRVGFPAMNVSAFSMSTVGMPSVMQTASGIPASAASMMASAANGGGTKMTVALAPGLAHRVVHAVEDRPAFVRRAALAGGDAADDGGAVRRGRLGVKRPFAPGESLDDEPRVLVEENGHGYFFALCERDDLVRRLAHRVGRREVQAALLQHPLAFLDVGAFHPDDDRHRHAELLDRGNDALRQHVAAQDAAEDVDEHRLDVLVGHQDRKAFLICSALAPPPTSRKLAGSPPASLMMSIVAIARPAPLTMQPMLPSRRM